MYFPFINMLARAGGGGSSSSEGGGGGEFLALITYFPSNWLAKVCKKMLPRHTALIVTAVGASVATLFILFLLPVMASSAIGFYLIFCLIAGVWAGWYAAMYSFWERMGKRLKKADTDLATAVQADGSWDENSLRDLATRVFMKFQDDWSRRDASQFATYLTPGFSQHMGLVLRALTELKRYNRVLNPTIIKMDFSNIHDSADNSQDNFSVFIEAKATDEIYDEDTQTTLHTTSKSFIEEWTFYRNGSGWLLGDIKQSTADLNELNQSIKNFATSNNFYYSLDWGWLLLPKNGLLMKDARFGVSDINNHAIGAYHGHLVQLYTYRTALQNRDQKNYLVGQINLPKSYGGIVIKRKGGVMGGSLFSPKGYTRYNFEWPDFNSRYEVFATEADRLATFELLNPGFMAFLYDNFEGLNIEVVDNVVYFYTESLLILDANYTKLLEVLLRAFKELQL